MPGVTLDTQAYRLATVQALDAAFHVQALDAAFHVQALDAAFHVQALDAAFHGQNKSLDKEARASTEQRRS
jgi:hypothetical protein